VASLFIADSCSKQQQRLMATIIRAAAADNSVACLRTRPPDCRSLYSGPDIAASRYSANTSQKQATISRGSIYHCQYICQSLSQGLPLVSGVCRVVQSHKCFCKNVLRFSFGSEPDPISLQ